MIEYHPFYKYINCGNNLKGGFIPVGTKRLIIGTFPPYETYINKGANFFYYSSEKNHLWNRFDNILNDSPGYLPLKKTKEKNANESLEENKNRKIAFCAKLSVGFIDVFSIIQRKINNSSADKHIISKETIICNGSLQAILEKEHIARICCVYSLAYDILKEWLLTDVNYSVTVTKEPQAANGEKLIVYEKDKKFEVVLLYPATRSGQKRLTKDNQYKRFIVNG